MAWYNPGDWDYGAAKNWLVGGNATKGLDAQGPNAAYAQGYLRDQLGGINGRAAPMAQAAQLGDAAQLNAGPQDQFRAQQAQTAGYLSGIMQGNRPGAGEIAVNRQVSSANAAQQAAMRSARGANAALMARNAMRNQADIGLAGAGQAAQAQLGDQMGAASQLGGILAQGRGQDLDMAGQNAQLQQQRMLQQGGYNQQTALANQAAQLQARGMNDAASQGYLAQLLGMDQAAFQRELMKRQLASQDKGVLPGLLQSGGSLATFAATGGFAGGLPTSQPQSGATASAPGNTGFGGYMQSWVPSGFGG